MMTEQFIVDFAMRSIQTTLLVSAPMLGFGLITGLVISIFQAVTSIQELTLTFIPKILAVFLALWSASAQQVQTSLGQLPGPVDVFKQASTLVDEHVAERKKELAFYERQEKRNAAKLAKDPDAKVKIRPYTGKPTFFDQILTSLITVFTGFLLASMIAIPIAVSNQGDSAPASP